MKKAILLLTAMCSLSTFAQAPNYAWAHKSQTIGDPDVAASMKSHHTVVDTVNHFVYCFSGVVNGIDFGDGEHSGSSNGGINPYIVKYTLDGALVWSKFIYSSNGNNPTGMAIDGSGNIIISGYSFDDTVRVNSNYLLNGNTNNGLAYIAKLDGNGNTIWLVGGSNDGADMVLNDLAIDHNGNLFATGIVRTSLGTFCGNALADGIFTIKLNASGVSQWFKQGSLNNYAEGTAIAVDHNGDCIIGGRHVNGFTLGSYTVPFNDGSTYFDRFLAKLSGNNGTYLWADANGVWQGPELVNNISTDGANNIYVSGLDTYAPDPMSSSATQGNYFEKRNSSGDSLWYKSYVSYAQNAIYATTLTSQATTPYGDTYVLLVVNDSTDFNGTIVSSSPTYLNSSLLSTVVKYSASGTQVWVKQTTDNAFLSMSYGLAIALDQVENIYITGMLTGSVNFDNILMTNPDDPGYKDFFLAKLGNEPLGIAELKTKELLVYPNPSNGICALQFDGNIEHITITNTAGIEVLNTTSTQLDLSGYAAGMYIVTVTSGNDQVQTKLMIK